jgi:hypothetical protein
MRAPEVIMGCHPAGWVEPVAREDALIAPAASQVFHRSF